MEKYDEELQQSLEQFTKIISEEICLKFAKAEFIEEIDQIIEEEKDFSTSFKVTSKITLNKILELIRKLNESIS